MERTLDEVSKVIHHAKLEPEDFLPVSQTIHFESELLDQTRIRLVELDKSLIGEFESGSSLVFRGGDADSVVLCTKERTYDVKEAETSNSLVVLNSLKYPEDIPKDEERRLEFKKVSGIFHRYLELKECKPRLQRLHTILSEKPFTENTRFEEGSESGFTTAELLNIIQCSEKELAAGLQEYRAIQFRGLWYILESDYHMKVLSHILNLVKENSWSLDAVDKHETLESLRDIEPEDIISQVFDFYFHKNDNGAFSAVGEKISRFFGEFFLQPGSTFNLDEFLNMWQEALPEGVTAHLCDLRGLAVVKETERLKTIRSFPETLLPDTISDRLDTLFRVQEKWTVEEITPYVEKLTTPKLNVNALLTKFARGSSVKGVKYFSSKHGK